MLSTPNSAKKAIAKEESSSKLKNRVRKGDGFCTAEDASIAKAWIAVSEDATVGAEQKCNAIYRGVHEPFSFNFKPATTSPLTFESIKKKIKMVLKCCTAFAVAVRHAPVQAGLTRMTIPG